MATHQVINDFLAQEHIAFVGASLGSPSSSPTLCTGGYEARDGSSTRLTGRRKRRAIEGDVAYRRLADVPDPVDLVGAAEVAKRLNTEGPHWDLRL